MRRTDETRLRTLEEVAAHRPEGRLERALAGLVSTLTLALWVLMCAGAWHAFQARP